MSVKSNNQLNSNYFNYSIIVNDQSKRFDLKLARIKSAIYYIRSQHLNQLIKQTIFKFFNYGKNVR